MRWCHNSVVVVYVLVGYFSYGLSTFSLLVSAYICSLSSESMLSSLSSDSFSDFRYLSKDSISYLQSSEVLSSYGSSLNLIFSCLKPFIIESINFRVTFSLNKNILSPVENANPG